MIRLVVAFFALSAGAAAAQAIPVRTAEHDGFTRVAIDFRRGTDWRLEQEGRSVRILTEGVTMYDLSDVYRRISAERVRTFKQTGPKELLVELACDCSPETFAHGNSVVLDVFPQSAGRMIEPLRAELNRASVPNEPLAHSEPLLPGLLTRSVTAEVAPAPAADFMSASLRAERAAALRSRLIADLGLDAGKDDPQQGAPAIAPEVGLGGDPARPDQMQVESRVERDTRGYEKVSPRAVCPAFAGESLGSWAEVRQTLSPEVGDEPWATAEAKRLISRGFGIEAERLLDVVGSEDWDTRILARIAQLVDAPGPAPEIADIAECSDTMTLFALISDPPVLPLRVGSVINALSSAPEEARPNLERRAVAGLMALGREEDARVVAGAAARRETPGTPPDLTSLALAAGDGPVPAGGLEEIVSRRTPEAAAAIRLMVDGMVEKGSAVPPILIDQARTLLPETTGTNRDRLLRAIVRAEIAAARYLRAAEDIDSLARHDPVMAGRLNDDLFTAVLAIEDDALFLTQIVSLGDRPVPKAEMRIAIADRIAKNHVPKLALRTLSKGAENPSTEERLLRASLALKAGAADDAEAYIAGLTGPEPDTVREQIAAARAVRLPAPQNDPEPAPSNSVRARGSALVEQSATLRSELERFLGN